ncbi:hypothetical protein PoB_001309700 [Plakobranchus ocellatus]|uniref:Uncharacterized protein n=1 Tax=Plakobranchus ocellatus TaxID=259542 RepID=A0AAV3YW66_9GAST|nr:hypothetical protein PoB_001309700 [Plakobranchus ocellatus]
MPREIKPPSRYITDDGLAPQLARRVNTPQTSSADRRNKGKAKGNNATPATPRPSRPASGRHVHDSIVIADDDSDVEIVEPPKATSSKRKREEEKDPDWGSRKKISKSWRPDPSSSKPARTPQPQAGQAQALQRMVAKSTPVATRTGPAKPQQRTPVLAAPPAVRKMMSVVDLYMECQDEPLSLVQVQAVKREQLQFEKSQLLIRAAKEGRLLFTPSGETKVLMASESALRSAGTLLSRVQALPSAPWPDGAPKA